MQDLGSELAIPVGDAVLRGTLAADAGARGVVLFAHGSGSSRHSPRNQSVARLLRDAGLGTLLFDLLTAEEEQLDARTGRLRFDIEFLAERLLEVSRWLREQRGETLPLAYFGASTGAAAALIAATRTPYRVSSIVSRGGRPDLAGGALGRVGTPTLLIVGGNDPEVLALNRRALAELRCEKRLEIVPGATHLFQEPGALEKAGAHARAWFLAHFPAGAQADQEVFE